MMEQKRGQKDAEKSRGRKAGQAADSLSDINPEVVVFIVTVPCSLDTYLVLQAGGEEEEKKEKYC